MKKSDRRGALFGFFPAIIHPEANVENPRMCSAMTLTCWLQLVFVVYLLTIHDAPETEVWRPGVEFVAGLIATMFLIPAVKGVGRRFGSMFGTAAKLKKARNLRKFSDQGWQLAVHASFALFEYYIMSRDTFGSRTWWSDIDSSAVGGTWEPTRQQNDLLLQRFTLMQLAVWFYTAFSHRYVEARHKDYFMMFGHHVVTIALISLAVWQGSYRIVLLVLWCHDFSDVFLDLMKMSNYMGWEGLRYLFTVEILFVSVVVSWFYWRLYLYPLHVIRSVGYGPLFFRESSPFAFLSGGFEFFRKQDGLQPHGQEICFALLCVLAVMHVFWFYLILRIAYKLIKGTKAHEAGADEYEGDSSDSEDEWEDAPGKQTKRPPCLSWAKAPRKASSKKAKRAV